MQPYKVEVENLTKIFNTKKGLFTAVKEVNFALEECDFISLVGPSGCGKSTVIRMLDGIIKPTSGKIFYSGEVYENGVSGEILKKLGFIFQKPNLLPWLTVRGNLELPLKVFKMYDQKHRANINRLLKIVNLEDVANAYPIDLSQGMIQRIGVIRAMVHEPDILFMDEPFGSLDELTREQLDMEMLSIWKQTGKSVIFITHNITEAILMSSRVVVMGTDPGRVVQEVKIDLPRPRTLDMINTDKFIDYEQTILNLIGKLDLSKIK